MLTSILLQALPEEAPPPIIDFDSTLFIQFGLFVVMYIVLSQFLFKPYLKMRGQRHQSIEGAKHEAEKMVQKSADMLADYEQQLAKAQARGADERAKMRQEAVAYERQVLGAAREESQKATEQSKMRLQIQTQQARTKLNEEAVALAKLAARRVLGREAV